MLRSRSTQCGSMSSCETDGHESKPSSQGGLNARTNDHTQTVTPEGVPEPTGCRGTAGWKAPSLVTVLLMSPMLFLHIRFHLSGDNGRDRPIEGSFRERALGCFARWPKSPPAGRHVVSSTSHRAQSPCRDRPIYFILFLNSGIPRSARSPTIVEWCPVEQCWML